MTKYDAWIPRNGDNTTIKTEFPLDDILFAPMPRVEGQQIHYHNHYGTTNVSLIPADTDFHYSDFFSKFERGENGQILYISTLRSSQIPTPIILEEIEPLKVDLSSPHEAIEYLARMQFNTTEFKAIEYFRIGGAKDAMTESRYNTLRRGGSTIEEFCDYDQVRPGFINNDIYPIEEPRIFLYGAGKAVIIDCRTFVGSQDVSFQLAVNRHSELARNLLSLLLSEEIENSQRFNMLIQLLRQHTLNQLRKIGGGITLDLFMDQLKALSQKETEIPDVVDLLDTPCFVYREEQNAE